MAEGIGYVPKDQVGQPTEVVSEWIADINEDEIPPVSPYYVPELEEQFPYTVWFPAWE